MIVHCGQMKWSLLVPPVCRLNMMHNTLFIVCYCSEDDPISPKSDAAGDGVIDPSDSSGIIGTISRLASSATTIGTSGSGRIAGSRGGGPTSGDGSGVDS